ncbi:hypothetical protein F441_22080 [Phytophthora nicotianae CJ01A1]|uniref:Uncharacterized protein n=1 Tax=Phytophthora nicotianae CJ01A1 TaxID=1317063 RepID=W2VQP5_PHYNI|nr:hypothetical protein F441_22080 [Phytophthora nicotianae CJ01A1]
MRLTLLVQKLAEYWESTQVELHGFYSVERVRELIAYNEQASIFRALAVLALVPWPCVVVTILVDLIPLRPPSEGLEANYLFIVRVFLAFWVATIVINLQFRHSVPPAPLSNTRIIVSGALTAVLTTGVVYALSMNIGFPLPFGIITVSPIVENLELKPKATSFKGVPKQIVYSPSRSSKGVSLRKVFSVNDAQCTEDITQLELEYAQHVQKVLYITEFMLLINYVEVIVPVIFSANLLVMYHLPNRVYYSQIDSMDDTKLWSTVGNVMLYCFLQLVSLVILFMMLWHKLHISALKQLAFVLEKQGEQVQTKLVFWVFYNVQATLQHFASDYTFMFAWLHNSAT